MASATATSVAATVEGTWSWRAVFNTVAAVLGRSRSWGALLAGARWVLFVSLLVSTGAARLARAESVARSTEARLSVSVNVVSTCSIDSSAASPLRCASPTPAQVTTRTVEVAPRTGSTQVGRYTLTTIDF